jgi:hypothetical protein
LENGNNSTPSAPVLAPDGIDHIVEVAFGAKIEADVELLKQDGSIASCEYQESLMLSAHWRVSVHPLFNSRIWEQPHNQDQYIACARNGRTHEGNCQRERIHENGRQALPVSSDGLGDFRFLPVLRDEGFGQNEIGDSGTEQHDSIHRHGTGRDAVLTEPRR